jgi:hypothetical protein
MATYAGETVRIWNGVQDFDGETLVPDDVESVTIEIDDVDGDGEPVVALTPMDWDVDSQRWFYDWDTEPDHVGTFRARLTVNGPGTGRTWEYQKIRLKADPA